MKKLIISALILGSTTIACAGTQTNNPYEINKVAEYTAEKLYQQDPTVNVAATEQQIIKLFAKASPNGMCCKTYYDGNLVQGDQIAAHGHIVCVPNLTCG